MNKGLREYLDKIGAKPINSAAMAEYDRQMREETIPAIERAEKAQRRAAHFECLGIPDPLASVDTHPKGGDVKQAPLVSGAVGSEADETPNLIRTTIKGKNDG